MFLSVICIAFGAGSGALLGIFFGLKSPGKTLAFTGGLMLGIVIFDLLPEAFAGGEEAAAIAGLGAGAFFVWLASRLINKSSRPATLTRTGIILALAMALHNIPEGMAIGSAALTDFRSGVVVAFVIAIHDIPEGMAVAAPFVRNGKMKALGVALLSGLSTVTGAALGTWFGSLSAAGLSFSLSAAAGAMGYVVGFEMLPQAREETEFKIIALFTLLGMILGGILLKIIK
ncbi:MAG TPA: ZIP family metal transporter [Acholeplasmataceae bacterium]|nr:ZIP family metal transporter [Acholeplasmataceae bacterium]